jgi:NaMN:DMB phosphoribosyltransferase
MFSDGPQERYPSAEKVGWLSQMKPRPTITRLVAPNGRIGNLLALSPEINTTSAMQSGKKPG